MQDKTNFKSGLINRDLFHNPNIQEIMQYNFIIVQHFVSSDSEHSEGNRLQSMYTPTHLPHLAIINPLTGSEEHVFALSEIETQERFLDGSMVSVLFAIVTAFLASCEIENLPAIASPTVGMRTSNHHVEITPANTRPLRSSSWKRPAVSAAVPASRASSSTPRRSDETPRDFVDISAAGGTGKGVSPSGTLGLQTSSASPWKPEDRLCAEDCDG